MNKISKIIFISFSLLFFIVAVLIFRPVHIVAEKNTISESGIVKEIYTNKGNDIIFILENVQRRFYINRGLEMGLELTDLKKRLIGNSIVVKYPKYWTPLDWNDKIKHISKVEFNHEILFNELKESSDH